MFDDVKKQISSGRKTWLITGVAGFIGSHLLETLLKLDQRVIGLDNFLSGTKQNLNEVKAAVSSTQWSRFKMITGDIRDLAVCHDACTGVDFVLHHAAVSSVQKSLSAPSVTQQINVDGFVNVLRAAKTAGVEKLVYASSGAVYNSSTLLPMPEWSSELSMSSPYAVSKRASELYAYKFMKDSGMCTIGLRYFNIYGPRMSAGSCVVHQWVTDILTNRQVYINGSDEISRDFCYVSDAVYAALLACITPVNALLSPVFNVGTGHEKKLSELLTCIKDVLKSKGVDSQVISVVRSSRNGDLVRTLADISQSKNLLGYIAETDFKTGISLTIAAELANPPYK